MEAGEGLVATTIVAAGLGAGAPGAMAPRTEVEDALAAALVALHSGHIAAAAAAAAAARGAR